MKRICVLTAVLFPIFANNLAAGGSELVVGQMTHPGAIVLTENLKDRCLMSFSCSASCTLCAAALFRQSASLADYGASWADFHPALVTATLSERPYRPPKPGRLPSL